MNRNDEFKLKWQMLTVECRFYYCRRRLPNSTVVSLRFVDVSFSALLFLSVKMKVGLHCRCRLCPNNICTFEVCVCVCSHHWNALVSSSSSLSSVGLRCDVENEKCRFLWSTRQWKFIRLRNKRVNDIECTQIVEKKRISHLIRRVCRCRDKSRWKAKWKKIQRQRKKKKPTWMRISDGKFPNDGKNTIKNSISISGFSSTAKISSLLHVLRRLGHGINWKIDEQRENKFRPFRRDYLTLIVVHSFSCVCLFRRQVDRKFLLTSMLSLDFE